MKSFRVFASAISLFALISAAAAAETVRLPKDRYLDKCKGAWAGQMIGVCFGYIYEFKSNGKPITDPLEPWTPGRVKGAIGQDDCYVEMTFLKAIEDHGLDVTFEQAGKAFAETQFPLWHANFYGRQNVRHGIMPPKSGSPEFNKHADDIDFQIESDLFGILCPGLPQESNRLCNVFGHVMNYGDGVYGGMFMAGMYCAAYFEDTDVGKVVQAGLDGIPKESLYAQCIADVIRWHAENPNDWLASWNNIEKKWQDDVDCEPGNPMNIDAKLNGAYVVMGLLYGNGDLAKTVEFATRCGQDSDCNPSNAAGVLCCMKGFAALGPEWVGGIAEIENTNFSNTNYSFKTLIPVCQKVTDAIIRRAGGEVASDAYVIPKQAPVAPQPLEQWTDQKVILSRPIAPHEVQWWNPLWKVLACGPDMNPGFRDEAYGRKDILVLHPVSKDKPAVIAADLKVPDKGDPKLLINVTSDKKGDFVLKVFVKDTLAKEMVIDGHGKWTEVDIDMKLYKGETVPVRIENHANGWEFEAAYLGVVEVK